MNSLYPLITGRYKEGVTDLDRLPAPALLHVVYRIMKDYGIKTMKDRYRERGWLTLEETAGRLGITAPTLRYRLQKKQFKGEYIQVEERNTLLFNPATLRAE